MVRARRDDGTKPKGVKPGSTLSWRKNMNLLEANYVKIEVTEPMKKTHPFIVIT